MVLEENMNSFGLSEVDAQAQKNKCSETFTGQKNFVTSAINSVKEAAKVLRMRGASNNYSGV